MSDPQFQTPSKPAEENEQVTTQKVEHPGLVESKYEEVKH